MKSDSLVTALGKRSGSVLIIVLWIAFGIVSLALYFGQSVTMELRASDNRVASLAARQAIDGTARYIGYLLTHLDEPGKLPALTTYQHEDIQMGEARVWLLGRDSQPQNPTKPYFALVDEASKLNLNTATLEMLQALPGMTAEFAAAIIDWRDADSDVTTGGAEDETYLRLIPPYHCKNAKFESLDELRLVFGANLTLLYGEDSNRNGALDPNEDNGDVTPPADNRDGKLDAGLFEYLTVYSRESGTNSDGTARVSILGQGRGAGLASRLGTLVRSKFSSQRADQIIEVLGRNPRGGPISSPLELFVASGMTENEFTNIESSLIVTNGTYVEGLINVCTASAQVLACIPGIGTDKATEMVNYRLSNPDKMGSVAWVKTILGEQASRTAGPFLTAHGFQYTADIAAVGRYGRGFTRHSFVFDSTGAAARIVQHQDLTQHGWALGRQSWQNIRQLAAKTTR